MSNIEVIGLGALNIDKICLVEHILGDGETAADIAPGYSEAELSCAGNFPGGSAANTIYGLAKLGIISGFVGAVGDDAGGRALIEDFQKAGVDSSRVKTKPGANTGLALCLIDKLNFRKISVSPGANNLLDIGDMDLDYLNRSRLLHISSFVDEKQFDILLELVDKLDSSVKISFSPGELYATRGLGALAPILARTHVLFLNEREIVHLTGKDFNTGAADCLAKGCHIVVVTLGKGAAYKNIMATAYIMTADREYVVEPDNKNMVSALDTTGAGDAFAAGFLYGLLKGKGLKECGQLGDIVARFSIAKIGARQGLPTLEELSRRYQQLYNRKL